jgi:hypothetical protein
MHKEIGWRNNCVIFSHYEVKMLKDRNQMGVLLAGSIKSNIGPAFYISKSRCTKKSNARYILDLHFAWQGNLQPNPANYGN